MRRRLPLRLRLAAAFAAAMALVLVATGLFLYAQLGSDLASALDGDLRLRAQDLAQVARDPKGSLGGEGGGRLIERGESFAQLLDRRGAVLDATRGLRGRALVDPAAIGGTRFFDRPSVPGLDEGARLLAVPVTRGRLPAVLVVGATRENRAEALRALRTRLLLAGPIALALATLLGYVLAGAGLRTVEAMRRRAEAISGDAPGERLPVPATGDELEHLGHTLNAMLARLDDALLRERRFVADAGHELRTPLALMRAELDDALGAARSEAELRHALSVASEETDRLSRLAADLLALAAAGDGALPLRVEDLDLVALTDSVRNRFALRADERQLTVDVPPGLMVRADRLRLEQLLANLVDNGLRHGAGTVHLRAERVGSDTRLTVSDEGDGIPAAFVDKAFGRFTRADAARARGGAGLGLAIVDAIARAHGGTAEISGPRRNALVVTLPGVTSDQRLSAAPPDAHPAPVG